MLKKQIKALPQYLRKRWQNALKYLPSVEMAAEGAYDQRLPIPAGPDASCGFELLATSGDEYSKLEAEDGAYSALVGGVEVVNVKAFDLAECFKRARALRSSQIAREESSDEVWSERIAPVARYASRASIIDRYAMIRFLRAGQRSGVCRVLRWLVAEHGMKKVDIYMSDGGEPDCELLRSHVVRMWDEACDSRTECSIRGYVIDDRDFGRISHDRIIRLDRYCIELGIGLDVFDEGRVWRDSSFGYRVDINNDLTQREFELRAVARISSTR